MARNAQQLSTERHMGCPTACQWHCGSAALLQGQKAYRHSYAKDLGLCIMAAPIRWSLSRTLCLVSLESLALHVALAAPGPALRVHPQLAQEAVAIEHVPHVGVVATTCGKTGRGMATGAGAHAQCAQLANGSKVQPDAAAACRISA